MCSDVFSRLSIPTHHGPRQCSKPCLLCSKGQFCRLSLFVSFYQVHFLFSLSPQFPPISPTGSFVLFCDLLYLLLVVYKYPSEYLPFFFTETCWRLQCHESAYPPPPPPPLQIYLAQIAWRCFSASEVQNDHKNKAWDNGGVRERDHSVYMWKLCLRSRCVRPLPGCAYFKSFVAVESRASEVHFTLDICNVPRPRPRSYSVVFLSDVLSAPEQEVVLQVEEEGMILAVVEMRCGAAYTDEYKYRLHREGWPLDEEEDKEVSQSWKTELILDKLTEPG